MTRTPHDPDPAPEGAASPDARPRRRLSEDWIATALGLALLALVLAGVLTDGLVP